MLTLHARLAEKEKVHDRRRERIEKQIADTDAEINNLVYSLYEISADQRALVESQTAR